MEEARPQYSKPIIYHQDLIDALRDLKVRAPIDRVSWRRDTPPEVVAEAFEKGCVVDCQCSPALTTRGEVVSRMRVHYKSALDLPSLCTPLALFLLLVWTVLVPIFNSWSMIGGLAVGLCGTLGACAWLFWKLEDRGHDRIRVVEITPQ